MSEPTKFSEFVLPELSKTRLDAQWARIMERRSPERKRLGVALPAAGVLVAAFALAVLWWPGEGRNNLDTSGWEGSVVASDDAPVEMTLAEGTHIQVDPRSELKFLHSSSHAVQVRLGHGSARFQVAKKRTRRFSVNLGKVEVVVTGTQFRVHRKAGPHGERVQVQVEEGSVEVHRGDGGVVALHAGENWSTVVPPEPRVSSAAVTEPGSSEDEESREGELDVAPGTEEAEEAEAQDDEQEVDTEDESAEDERRSSRAKRASARKRRASREAAADAGDLFDHANLARRAGRLEDAAELYADVVSRYPRDRRASLAAFELGRLRMDSLRDVRGAVKALERALKLDEHGAFAEDALARLVLAEEATGDHAGCSRARSRYLARYPEGVHAQHVTERCGGN